MAAGCTFQFGPAYLIPAFRGEGLSLGQAGLLAAAPSAGLLATLVAWGAAADRWGERIVLTTGLALAGITLVAATAARGTAALGICFVPAGAAGASVHASSGRLILGWFAAHERGLAMGLRQTAQPLGVAVAALTLPPLATRASARHSRSWGCSASRPQRWSPPRSATPNAPSPTTANEPDPRTVRRCCGASTPPAHC